jgi:hypothetical protein
MRRVLSKDFELPTSDFKSIPLHERYIFQAAVPPSLGEDKRVATEQQGNTPESFSFSLVKQGRLQQLPRMSSCDLMQYARCTGIPTPMRGSIGSAAPDSWACL